MLQFTKYCSTHLASSHSDPVKQTNFCFQSSWFFMSVLWGLIVLVFCPLLHMWLFICTSMVGQCFGEATSLHSHIRCLKGCIRFHLLKSLAFCAFLESIKFCRMLGKLYRVMWKTLLCIETLVSVSPLINCVTLGRYLTFCKRVIINLLEGMH